MLSALSQSFAERCWSGALLRLLALVQQLGVDAVGRLTTRWLPIYNAPSDGQRYDWAIRIPAAGSCVATDPFERRS